MDAKVWSFIFSAVALILYSASYFFNNKKNYLILQLIGNVFLSASYMLMGAYFTMVSVGIGVGRGLICYAYEKRNKNVPVYVVLLLCLVNISSYILINHVILSESSVFDIFYLVASCLYAVTFTVRNMKLMRYLVLIPHSSAILYNLLVNAPITSAISYGIELMVTVVAIVKFHLEEKQINKGNDIKVNKKISKSS